ncbi:TM271 protein, partial [Pachyramphus minor]|nr:TM271 protein [Pachyramphus minor]
MKWSVRGACAALSSCLLLACALSAAAVGLKCFSLGSELKGEPFRLGTAAGAFYSGLLLAAGLSLLAAALLCKASPGGRQNFLLLGVLVFMLGVLSAFAGAVIDGDTVSLVERKYSHYCLLQPGGAARPRTGPTAPDGSAAALRCQKLRDYQQGLVLSTAGVEVHCGGHPSVELPGYSPMDPELNASYPYCYPVPSEQPPAYEEIYPGEPCAAGT